MTSYSTPKYIQDRYQESFMFLRARKQRQVQQLVLINNLERGDQNIASTLLLTLFNRVMSSLYDDKIQVKFVPSQEVDQQNINALNILAQSDYREMAKSKIDYDWCWDALFFGRGYCETIRFDKKKKVMKPEVINPLVFGYDPFFEDPKQWRYYWKWITKSKVELDKLYKAKQIYKDPKDIPNGVDPYLWNYKLQRDRALKGILPATESSASDVYQILEYYGYNDEGKKCVYWLDKDLANVLMKEELDLKDGSEIVMPNGEVVEMDSTWPIVVKESFRIPHSSVPLSVADILEDKHRAKSVLLNLAYIAAKDTANPLYGYNPDKVRDVSQFLARQIEQHIPMDDETAAWPLAKADSMSPQLIQFISILQGEANEPIGTGLTMQPAPNNKNNTATEAAIDQQLNDMAQSLQSKVLQFGEEEFWLHWINRYKRYAKEGDTKMAAIVGVKGTTFEKVHIGEFKNTGLPGVLVYSAKEAEYKELVLRRDLMQLYPNLAQTMDQDGLRNFNKYVFMPKFLNDPSMVDLIFPKTLDEIKAEEENQQLEKGEMPNVLETDNHTTHLYVHQQATPKTWALWMHIAWHEELLAQQKQQQMVQSQQIMQQQMQQSQNKEATSPIAQASPLKSEFNPSDQLKTNSIQQ